MAQNYVVIVQNYVVIAQNYVVIAQNYVVIAQNYVVIVWGTSIINYFSDKANEDIDFFTPEYLNSRNAFSEYNPLDWDVVMAYGTYLIDWGETNYIGALNAGDRVYQNTASLLSGSSRELTCEVGMNYDDKFFAGILIGLSTLDYNRNVVYEEFAHENNISEEEEDENHPSTMIICIRINGGSI
jgi:hypothetical protein